MGNRAPASFTPWRVTGSSAASSFSLHAVPDGYPWTHLGYTYNWAPSADRYGASEYVIRKDAQYPIVVVSNVAPEAYCAPEPR